MLRRLWTAGLERGGHNDFRDGLPLRPAPPPPMYPWGSCFPHFDVKAPMPASTRNPKAENMTDNQDIARVCHEVNRALCVAFGDLSQKPWAEAEQWQRDSAIKGVEYAIANPDGPVSAQHDAWSADKVAEGWVYGPVKDATAKTHPCLVPFDDLPAEQKAKDHLFKAVVRSMAA